MGLLHIYCGDGKGKTSAAVGLALRMAGCGKKAVVVRFLKKEDSGEAAALRTFPQVMVLPCTECFGFTWQMTEEEKRRSAEYCRKQFQEACGEAKRFCAEAECAGQETKERTCAEVEEPEVLLVLDELCAALNSGLLELSPVLAFLDSRPSNLEVAVTGRKPPEELLSRADYVTELRMIAHPFTRGVGARRGIEY